MNQPTNKPAYKHVWGFSAIALVLFLLLSAGLIYNVEMLFTFRLISKVWFLILLVVGLLCAICLFSLFKSYAAYSGKAFGGTLRLGGPCVLMLLIVVLGVKLAPDTTADFSYTIILETTDGQPLIASNGQLLVDLDAQIVRGEIAGLGEVTLKNIPSRFMGETVRMRLSGNDQYQLNEAVKLVGQSARLIVELKEQIVRGIVKDKQGLPVAGATVITADQSVTTSVSGQFQFKLPANLSETERVLHIMADGYMPYNTDYVFSDALMQVQLTKVH
ncbi:hypothetical protein C3B51_00140 [Pseudoalteromonas rubra]|uniref:Carboxypeptidase regulatory-like domain-containing protein n=1 Tax=Pseudoalteromonas rubra TaxID=43658 RepID=A0A4Q7ELX3_9GAMM|nr:carboxypeptidase-like regulatory domain-containing protein [Pseudoalteromonas rubra]RZM85383.1 hypothetical protein C3B51_00140 [Pseudoalteromonas rubra]